MTTLATPQLEQYISQQIVSGQTVVFDEFIFANIPNLTADNLQNHLVIPSASHIVHRQVVSQTGVVNQNSVVYSVTIGSDIGDFDFNFIGLINKSKGLLGIAIYTDTVKKLKNKNGIQGNSLTRSILLEFSNAPQHTNITVPAETWQIDFTLRLNGLDEKIRLTNRDLYGRAVFFDDGFLLKRKSGNNFTITAGTAYVEGVRTNIIADENITLALPCSVYVDVVHHCTVTGAYQTEVKFLKAAKGDYLDAAGNQHYVQILADIDLNGNITDRRLLSPLLGINPKDLNDETESKADKTGHTHKLPLASLLKKGITKLFSGLDSDAEDMAATPKAIKALKSLIDAITRNLNNYIPNSKKSNAVNSNSADTVATSVAVKTAHDKALEAKSIAEAKQSPATTLAGYGITDFLVKGESSTTNARTLLKDGIYAFGSSSTTDNLPSVHPYKLLNLAGNNPNWRHQIAIKAYSTEIYLSSQQSSGSDTWLEWKRIDGADWADIRNNPITIQQSLGTKDLDTVLEVGIYGQIANANAIPARHYPEQMAGTLLVTPSAYGVQQEYTTFYLNRKYVRGRRDNNAWSNWTRIDGVDKVDKSGDTMTGALEINAPDTFIRFKRNGENIGFAGTPNTTSENIKLHSYKHDTFLELQAAKAYINKALELAGNIAIKSGDYSSVELFNRANKRLIFEVSPDSTSSIGNIIYRNASNSNEANISLPRKTGTMALISDIKDIVVLQGVINHGGTLPLPSGFNESQCNFIISTNNSNPNGETWDWNESFKGKHYRNICELNGRVVTCQTIVNDGIWGNGAIHTIINGKANYMVIGVK